jgi:hypothetical protein
MIERRGQREQVQEGRKHRHREHPREMSDLPLSQKSTGVPTGFFSSKINERSLHRHGTARSPKEGKLDQG